MLFQKVAIEFPRVVYPKVQVKWDGLDYLKLESIIVDSLEEYQALKGEYVLNFREVTNQAPKKQVKKQTSLEV